MDELESIYAVVANPDPTLEAPSSAWVRDVLFPPSPERGTSLDVSAEILRILEEGSFFFGQRADPDLLARRGWTEPAEGEMQLYANSWATPPRGHVSSTLTHHPLRHSIQRLARAHRNAISHRESPLPRHGAPAPRRPQRDAVPRPHGRHRARDRGREPR